jgi:hypothetical protein
MDPGFKGLLTRLQTVAYSERVSVEDLVQRPDNELMRLPNMGRKTVALARGLRGRREPALWFWAEGVGPAPAPEPAPSVHPTGAWADRTSGVDR